MSDVQADINESQSVQAAFTAASEAQAAVAAVATQTPAPVDAVASVATPGNDPLEVKPDVVAEPATAVEPQVIVAPITSTEPAQGVINVEVEHTGEPLGEQHVEVKAPVVDHAIAGEGVKVEPEGELRTTKSPSVMGEAKAEIAAKSNTGAALAEQRAAFKVGGAQAGNAMDTMHGSVNRTWPPTFKS